MMPGGMATSTQCFAGSLRLLLRNPGLGVDDEPVLVADLPPVIGLNCPGKLQAPILERVE
jgi:hypothetical protein